MKQNHKRNLYILQIAVWVTFVLAAVDAIVGIIRG